VGVGVGGSVMFCNWRSCVVVVVMWRSSVARSASIKARPALTPLSSARRMPMT
jgi:hypothetical protein